MMSHGSLHAFGMAALLFSAVACTFVTADCAEIEPLRKRLDAASEDYTKDMKKYEETILKWFSQEEAKARKAADTVRVDELTFALQEYRNSRLPPIIAPGKVNRQAWGAKERFESALVKIAGEYTKQKEDGEADRIQKLLSDFRLATDRLPMGSRWVGVFTLMDRTEKAKPFQGTVDVLVTERSSSSVKFRIIFKKQDQWEYEFSEVDGKWLLMRAELVVVQNSFGEKLGVYAAEGALSFDDDKLIFVVSRKAGSTVRDIQYELGRIQ